MNIPNDYLPVEGQEGLYYKDTTFMFDKTQMISRDLRADDQHCFYDNTLPEEERIYMEWATIRAEWTSNFTCILRDKIITINGESKKPEIA